MHLPFDSIFDSIMALAWCKCSGGAWSSACCAFIVYLILGFGHNLCRGDLVRQRCRISFVILAYSWARPAILAAGKGRGGMFLFLLSLHFHSFSFLPWPSFSSLPLSLLSLFSLSQGDDTKWPTRVYVSWNPNTINYNLSICMWFGYLTPDHFFHFLAEVST